MHGASDEAESVASIFRDYRSHEGLSRDALAQALEVTVSHVSQIERGTTSVSNDVIRRARQAAPALGERLAALRFREVATDLGGDVEGFVELVDLQGARGAILPLLGKVDELAVEARAVALRFGLAPPQ